jgi:class 3 adenylate cyclase
MDWQAIARKFLPASALELLDRAGSAVCPGKRPGNVAVIFVDIEGCTRLCEDLPPHEMQWVIETYFSEYLDLVRAAGGEVTEVLGDGLLGVFDGPSLHENIARAMLAALRIRAATRALNDRKGDRHDPIVVNIGLNAGAALVGITRLRSKSDERWVFAATGPVTNIAARLCALATHGQILVSGAMVEWVPGIYMLRALGPRMLKNVSTAVEVFEVLSIEGERGGSEGLAGGGQGRLPR